MEIGKQKYQIGLLWTRYFIALLLRTLAYFTATLPPSLSPSFPFPLMFFFFFNNKYNNINNNHNK